MLFYSIVTDAQSTRYPPKRLSLKTWRPITILVVSPWATFHISTDISGSFYTFKHKIMFLHLSGFQIWAVASTGNDKTMTIRQFVAKTWGLHGVSANFQYFQVLVQTDIWGMVGGSWFSLSLQAASWRDFRFQPCCYFPLRFYSYLTLYSLHHIMILYFVRNTIEKCCTSPQKEITINVSCSDSMQWLNHHPEFD